MKDLLGKIGRFCENHVEKIVLVLVSAVCVWLFFTRVIFSPNAVSLDNRTFPPGQIDRYVYDQKAQELRTRLQRKKSGTAKAYPRRLDGPIDANDPVIAGIIPRPLPKGFAGLFESPLSFIGAASMPTRPAAVAQRLQAGRRYRLPLIPEVTSVATNHIRAAAYIPLQEITPQMTYDKAPVEPNDIDLVTVEAKIDVAEIFRRYEASFAGVDVQREEWRDPCLAKPVFAAVLLERQQQQEDGSWGGWQPVPRTQVETNRQLFQVIERVEDLPPGGLDVRMMLFSQRDVPMGLLQPEGYQIASAEEEWFPPSYYSKYRELQRRVESEERRKGLEQDRKQTNQRTTTDNRRQGTNVGGQGGVVTGGRGAPGSRRGQTQVGGGDMYGGASGQRGGRGGRTPGGTSAYPGDTTTTGRSRATQRTGIGGDALYGDYGGMMSGEAGGRRRTSTDEVYFTFSEELIRYREDLSKREKPLLFWVFDDTVEPGKTYQYRVRMGLFNPVAGTSQVAERDLDKKDQVILWSPPSEITKPVEIPQRVYLFAKDVRTNTATVEVARYSLGYWRTENFQVKPGEAIGKEMEPREDPKEKARKERERLAMGAYPGAASGRITDALGPMGPGSLYGSSGLDQQNVPKTVDFDTGKVLVDLVQVNDWGNAPNLRPRTYHEMLYTGDGMTIEHMPVSLTNWPRDLATAYQQIQTEKGKEQKQFRAFNKSGLRGRGRTGPGGQEGLYDESGLYDEQMMYEGGGLYPY